MINNFKLVILSIFMLFLTIISSAENTLFVGTATSLRQRYSIMECPLRESDGIPIYCSHDPYLTYEVTDLAISPVSSITYSRKLYYTVGQRLGWCNLQEPTIDLPRRIIQCWELEIPDASNDLRGMSFNSFGTKLYIVDVGNHSLRMCNLNRNGLPITQCPELLNQSGNIVHFIAPDDVAIVANNSTVLITDREAGSIIMCPLLSNGTRLGDCTHDDANWLLVEPAGIAADSEGEYAYIAEYDSYYPSISCELSGSYPFRLTNCLTYQLGRIFIPNKKANATRVVLSHNDKFAYFIDGGDGSAIFVDKIKKGQFKSSRPYYYYEGLLAIAYY